MFYDRYDAGEQLADRLSRYKNTDSVVLAIPNGGVLVGLVIAEKLELPLELVISRKVGHPMNKEYAICAVTEDGTRVCNEWGLCGVDMDKIETESRIQRRTALEKRRFYRKNYVPTSPRGKIAIIVDDGIATGLTMKAAVLAVKKQEPRKIVIAVPVALQDVSEALDQMVDATVVIEDNQNHFKSISSHYKYFANVFDKDVLACIHRAGARSITKIDPKIMIHTHS